MEEQDTNRITITKEHYINWTWTIIMVLVIIGGGCFIVRQAMLLIYTERILAGPCQLCVQLNPKVGDCWKMQNRNSSQEINYFKKIDLDSSKINESINLLSKQVFLNETSLMR